MSQPPIFEELPAEQAGLSKLAKKSKDSPFVPIGIAGFLTVLGIGAYKYKHRGNMTTSMFLMQLRVASQGTVIAALTIGMAYSMANEYIFNKSKTPELTVSQSSKAKSE